MTTQSDVVELVTKYLDGTMEPETRETFERHLETCDGCQRYLEQVRRVTALTERPPAESLSPEFQEHLVKAFSGLHAPPTS